MGTPTPTPARVASLVALAALVAGTVLVAFYDHALAPRRYPYSADSASYIEMAESLRAEGRPRVTPWDLEPGGADAVPQKLFPPGFPVLIAALTPFTGDVRSAAVLLPRIAAALLPVLLVVLWRGSAAPAALFGVGLWVLASPGVRGWQFIAYSDVPALALAVVATGALAGLVATPAGRAARGTWFAAGVAAGLCYTLRNAGIAVLAAGAATLCYAWLRHAVRVPAILCWGVGAGLPLAALAGYNLATFGRLQPYAMPPSERRWSLNLADYANAQLEDLGLPELVTASQPRFAAVLLLAALVALLARAWWVSRADLARHLRLTVLGLYALLGGALLVVSRSHFEWGNLIDSRNTLQYTFALALALVIAADTLAGPVVRRVLVIGFTAALVAVLVSAAGEAARLSRPPAELWLALSRNPAVIAAARDSPPATLLASNYSVLFRIDARRAARQLDVSGSDADFAGSLALLRSVAGSRPARFLLVCDPEWTSRFSACQSLVPGSGPRCVRIASTPVIVARCDPEAVPAGE